MLVAEVAGIGIRKGFHIPDGEPIEDHGDGNVAGLLQSIVQTEVISP